jgi:hypothetical protein
MRRASSRVASFAAEPPPYTVSMRSCLENSHLDELRAHHPVVAPERSDTVRDFRRARPNRAGMQVGATIDERIIQIANFSEPSREPKRGRPQSD